MVSDGSLRGISTRTCLVPGELTSGSATHVRPPEQGKVTNFPFTHCAKAPWMHAFSLPLHGLAAVRVWNWAFNACASFPFCSVNDARSSSAGLAAADRAMLASVRRAARRDMACWADLGADGCEGGLDGREHQALGGVELEGLGLLGLKPEVMGLLQSYLCKPSSVHLAH